MSASTMLFLIACVVAVLAFSLAAAIWAGYPVETVTSHCGTLRAPNEPPTMVGALTQMDPSVRIDTALAPERCKQAMSNVAFGHRVALASGGAAAVTAVGALLAGRREEHQREADAAAGTKRVNGLTHRNPNGRHTVVFDLCDPQAGE